MNLTHIRPVACFNYPLCGVLLILLWLNPSDTRAAYKVEIEAPKEISALLKQHLDLVRYKDRDDLSDDQLKYMLDTVNDQVTQLTSTEGYFLPTTTVTVDPTNLFRSALGWLK